MLAVPPSPVIHIRDNEQEEAILVVIDYRLQPSIDRFS
jgi:hypothetical protein